MSTRQRTSQQSSDLPPKRQGKVVRHDVSKPLQTVSLSRVVHVLTIFAILFTAFYAYRITQWKAEAGGWWNLLMGKRPPHLNVQHNGPYSSGNGGGAIPRANGGDVALENHIHSIASILGMQPTDIASALSNAVHQHVAPKSISSLSSSVSSSASAAGATAPIANILFDQSGDVGDANANSGPGKDESVVDKAGTVAKAVEALVGLDEPIMAD